MPLNSGRSFIIDNRSDDRGSYPCLFDFGDEDVTDSCVTLFTVVPFPDNEKPVRVIENDDQKVDQEVSDEEILGREQQRHTFFGFVFWVVYLGALLLIAIKAGWCCVTLLLPSIIVSFLSILVRDSKEVDVAILIIPMKTLRAKWEPIIRKERGLPVLGGGLSIAETGQLTVSDELGALSIGNTEV